MRPKSLQLVSQLAGGGFFWLLCARPLGSAGHAASCSRPLRSTLSLGDRRFVAQGQFAGAALAYVAASAAARGSRPFLRASGSFPARVGSAATLLRARLALGHRFSARFQRRRAPRSFVGRVAATRGSRRALRATAASLAHVAGGSTRFSEPPFRSRAATRIPVALRGGRPSEKAPNKGAAENRSGLSRWLLPPPSPPAAFPQPARQPSAVSELESLAVLMRTV